MVSKYLKYTSAIVIYETRSTNSLKKYRIYCLGSGRRLVCTHAHWSGASPVLHNLQVPACNGYQIDLYLKKSDYEVEVLVSTSEKRKYLSSVADFAHHIVLLL